MLYTWLLAVSTNIHSAEQAHS